MRQVFQQDLGLAHKTKTIPIFLYCISISDVFGLQRILDSIFMNYKLCAENAVRRQSSSKAARQTWKSLHGLSAFRYS